MDPAPDRRLPDLQGGTSVWAASRLRTRFERRPVDASIGSRTAVEEIGVRAVVEDVEAINTLKRIDGPLSSYRVQFGPLLVAQPY